MKTPRSAAIYARISSDPGGEGLGVQRQLEDCRRLATANGWEVGEEYVDNDISAFRNRTRPRYEDMLRDIANGRRDGVLIYNLDRLTRQPMELEQFRNICIQAGVTQVKTVTADFDLGNDDGLFMARVISAFAAKESDRKSARGKRKALERAERGLPGGGVHRPFGFKSDRITHDPAEAVIVREIAGRFIAGDSLRSIAIDLNNRGVSTVTGSSWLTSTLREMLRAGRIAGLRDYHGKPIATAIWEPIISKEQREQILSRFAVNKATNRRSPRRYLLSGMLRCGKCGTRLYSAPRAGTRRYVCVSGPDHQGCGGITILAEPVELWLSDAVLFRLSVSAQEFTNPQTDPAYAGLVDQLASYRAKMEELTLFWTSDSISSEEWKIGRDVLQNKLVATERQMALRSQTTALEGMSGTLEELVGLWKSLNLTRQASVVAAVIEFVTVTPAKAKGARDVAERLVPRWRS